jgi:Beta-ketoacyl synthase, N-terminal domain
LAEVADDTSSTPPAAEPIAIVGIGCRLAGSVTDPAQLWAFLTDGRSDVREVPAERWEPYLRRDPRNAAVLKETTRWGTFLDDLAGFDAEFFGVSPREAELMDPSSGSHWKSAGRRSSTRACRRGHWRAATPRCSWVSTPTTTAS